MTGTLTAATMTYTITGAVLSKSTTALSGFNVWWENLFKQEILSSRLKGYLWLLAKVDK